MAEWPPSLDIALNELEAFDAMRKFVENYWNVGGQSEDEIRYLLSAMIERLGRITARGIQRLGVNG